jgi:hypothetical protein
MKALPRRCQNSAHPRDKQLLPFARPIDSIRVGRRHRRDLGDIDRLAADIESIGCGPPQPSSRRPTVLQSVGRV